MNAGKLDAKILIQVPETSPGLIGDRIETLRTVANPWAEYRELNGRELTDAMQVVATVEVKFVVRYQSVLSSLGAKHQITYDGQEFDVLDSVKIPGNRPTRIEILAKRRNDR